MEPCDATQSKLSALWHVLLLIKPSAPPAPVKDLTEPADQQVDKSLPAVPTPSSADKLKDTTLPVKEKNVEKTTPKASSPQQKDPLSLPGSRGETRVTFFRSNFGHHFNS